MEIKTKLANEKHADLVSAAFEKPPVAGEDGNVVGIPEIASHLKCPLDELIERVEIDIRKKLRREVAERDPFPGRRFKTLNDDVQQLHRPIVLDPPFK